MKTLNLGILAHVDAGKTSLTERPLFDYRIIATLGSVDKGNTQTDSLNLEKQRGITIQSAVVSFELQNLKINLIDTPGHQDFVAEVERALSVLDVVILVISAVEGIQSQTLVLAKILQKLNIPTLIFINKIDRVGAKDDELITKIQTKLFPKIVLINTVDKIGTQHAKTTLVKNLSGLDIAKEQVRKMEICPVVLGSAHTGVGIFELTDTIEKYFQPFEDRTNQQLAGKVFKIEINSKGENIAYIRLFQGELKLREQIPILRTNQGIGQEIFTGKITKIQGFKNGKLFDTKKVQAPEIVKVSGLKVQIGDWLGESFENTAEYFAKPNLQVIIKPKNPDDSPKLYSALKNLSLVDPLISVEQSPENILSLKLYGEIQQEIIQTFLRVDYELEVLFEKTQAICIERVIGMGSAFAEKFAPNNMFIATLCISISPGKIGSGVVFDIGIGRSHLPIAFQKAIEESVYKYLKKGLYGWEVRDCVVEITNAGYDSFASDGGDFRGLTPVLLQKALKQAGTEVYEPINDFELEFSSDHLSQILSTLAKVKAKIDFISEESENMLITRKIPVRQIFDLEKQIPNLTSGQGVFLSRFSEYQKYKVTPSHS